MTRTNPSELLALRVLPRFYPGASLRLRDDQHVSVHDIDVVADGTTIAAVEVTTATDEERQRDYAAVRTTHRTQIDAVLARQTWSVDPEAAWQDPADPQAKPDARRRFSLRDIRKKLDRMLAEIEEETPGIKEFFAPLCHDKPKVLALWSELGIENGFVTSSKRRQHIVAYPGAGTRVDADNALLALSAEFGKADNRHKLGVAAAAEKTLFVVVDHLNYAAHSGIVDCDPPQTIPVLPPEVHRVIAVAEEGSYLVAWDATAKTPWRKSSWRDRDDTLLPPAHVHQQ